MKKGHLENDVLSCIVEIPRVMMLHYINFQKKLIYGKKWISFVYLERDTKLYGWIPDTGHVSELIILSHQITKPILQKLMVLPKI